MQPSDLHCSQGPGQKGSTARWNVDGMFPAELFWAQRSDRNFFSDGSEQARRAKTTAISQQCAGFCQGVEGGHQRFASSEILHQPVMVALNCGHVSKLEAASASSSFRGRPWRNTRVAWGLRFG